MTRLILLRHGETDWNVAGRLNSFTEVPLNEKGIAQAKAAGLHLAGVDLDIYVSPAVRATQTLESFLSMRPVGIHLSRVMVDERLRELSFGVYEGMTRREMADAGNLGIFIDWLDGRPGKVGEGCEELDHASARLADLVRSVEWTADRDVLFVTHGHIARILLLTQVLGGSPGEHRRLRFDNGRLAEIELEDTGFRLVKFNTLDLA